MATIMDRAAQMFPQLTPAQIDRISTVGHRRDVRAGDVLFDVGDQNTRFFVVLSGSVEIVRPIGDRDEPVTLHHPREFTGEINMLSARRSLVRARAASDGAVIAVDREDLRTLVHRDSDLSEVLMRAFILRRVALMAQDLNDLVLLGSRHSGSTQHIREFLSRNGQPFTYQDVETDPSVQALLDRFHVGVGDVPVIVCRSGHVLKNPSIETLAAALGLSADLDAMDIRDVVIVGAGPAGLAAAVYGASEGLDVLVIESTAPGGQAGTSSRIENYLGFPTGISGQALAGRALSQAEKFGAEVTIGRTVVRLDCDSRPYTLHLSDGQTIRTRTIVIASGVKYRKLDLPSLARFEGAGVYYCATYLESQQCAGEEVAIVGGANSAGQAAVFLAGTSKRVHMLVRATGLADSMSRYLIQRIENIPNIDLRARTQVEALEGDKGLERVRWRNLDTGERETRDIRNLFLMTGADPNTSWLEGCLLLDDKKFVKTGADLLPEDLAGTHWSLTRRPHLMETSIPGVFCVGDARSTSVKRVASAVGEGSICVQLVHRALQEL
ncbi:MAG TPA: FAD-dependent oxidoreductase [Polyangiaceae bacterium]|nr:FAD-dependent oxidoreductase [Polyangiaceae bacterium]